MKAQISLHIYMGSVRCRPHIKGVRRQEERRKKEDGGKKEGKDGTLGNGIRERGEIMKSRKEIKRERNQGGKMRGQRDTGKTLNEREMGS